MVSPTVTKSEGDESIEISLESLDGVAESSGRMFDWLTLGSASDDVVLISNI
jgi:hypothetical protein